MSDYAGLLYNDYPLLEFDTSLDKSREVGVVRMGQNSLTEVFFPSCSSR